MPTGLVLEGGAMRGLFTAGVLDVLMERGIAFDAAVGVSAGACFGCNFKSRQPGRALRYNLRFCKDPRYCGVRTLLRTGELFGGEFCYHTLPERLDLFDGKTYAENPMPFFVVCTDVETGEAYYRRCDVADCETYEWFRASASMPLVSKPVKLSGRSYLDGGIADPIPLSFMNEQGFEKNLVVLTQPRAYQKTADTRTPRLLRKHKALSATLRKRHEIYNSERDFVFEQEKENKAFILCPPAPLPVQRITHDPEKLQKTYDIGKETAEQQISALLNWMQ